MLKILVMIFSLLFAPPVPVQPAATCDELAAIYGAEVEPVDYSLPHGWDWDIADFRRVSTVWFANGGSLEQWVEDKKGKLWLFHFYDHIATFDENGEHFGLHHICVFSAQIR